MRPLESLQMALCEAQSACKTCLSLEPGKVRHSENEFCGNFDLISVPADTTVPDGIFESYSELCRP